MAKKDKHPGRTGRPTSYKPEYCKAIVDFFAVEPYKLVETETMTEYFEKSGDIKKKLSRGKMMPNALPTFFRFSEKIGVNQETLKEWTKKNKNFSVAFSRAKELQKEFLITLGLAGVAPPASFIFVMSNVTDWRSKGVDPDDLPPGSVLVPVIVNRGQPAHGKKKTSHKG